MEYKLQDLIDMDHFQNLQDRLNEIYSFPSAIIDNEGNVLTATAWQDICTQFHRRHPECRRLCIESDQYILSHLHEANPAVSYQCPHGLVDNATPIIIDGIHYGNFFTGQFFLEPPDMDFFKEQARKYGFDETCYLEAVRKVPIWSREQLNSYLFFIKGLITVISESGLKKLKEMENRKRIEEDEKRFRTLFELAPIGIAMSRDGITLDSNTAYLKMFGYENIRELEGKPILDQIAPQCRDDIMDRVKRRARGEPVETTYETIGLKRDGTQFPFLVSVTRLSLSDGPMTLSFFTDLTERKLAADALHRKEDRMRTILQTAMDGFLLLDSTGHLLEVNETFCRMSGFSEDELLAMHISALEATETPSETEHHMRKVFTVGEDRFETRHRRKDGSIYDVEVRVQYRPEDGGQFVAFLRDITKQNQIEAQLQQAQKMESIGTLAGGIAHDFNNILYPLLGFAELLKEDIPTDSPLQQHIDEILHAAYRSRDLVKQILAFSRKGEKNVRPLKMQPVISEALKLLRSSIPTTIEIESDLDADCGIIMADAVQIHQILMNLCTNAYHAMEVNGGILRIVLKEIDLSNIPNSAPFSSLTPGKYALITVSDTGTGIPCHIMDKIFDPYFTTKGVGKGTGLGLSVVQGIVKSHKGDIRIDSKPGTGTKVSVFLPIAEQPVETDAKEAPALDREGTERILLVDDDAPVANVEKQMLERQGYQVAIHTGSLQALEAFRANPGSYDLVITDMTMPRMTGLQLAAELIAIRPDIPVILCTGFSEQISNEKLKAIGIKGVLLKPINKAELAKTARKVLDESLPSQRYDGL